MGLKWIWEREREKVILEWYIHGEDRRKGGKIGGRRDREKKR